MHTGLSNRVLCYWMPSRDHIRFQLRHAQPVHRHPPSIRPPYEPAYDADGHQKSAKPKAMPPGDRDFIAVPRGRSEERYPATQRQLYVTAYISETGAVVAEYEYDAFGNTIVQSGSLADTFRHRFSTKPWIAALGAYDYGERLYSPTLRRWLSRDPIGEEGGANLYAMCGNDAVNGVDPLGLSREMFGCCSDERVILELSKKLKKASEMSNKYPIPYIETGRNRYGMYIRREFTMKIEYAGFICCKDGKVSSTGPFPGTIRIRRNGLLEEPPYADLSKSLTDAFAGRNGISEWNLTSGNVLYKSEAQCMNGARNVVFYHYHPDSSSFSQGDLGVSRQIPIALFSSGKSFIEIVIWGLGGQIIEFGKNWEGGNAK